MRKFRWLKRLGMSDLRLDDLPVGGCRAGKGTQRSLPGLNISPSNGCRHADQTIVWLMEIAFRCELSFTTKPTALHQCVGAAAASSGNLNVVRWTMEAIVEAVSLEQ